MKKVKKIKKPFFAKFLEAQKLDSTKTVKGGRAAQTMKAPSDNDEW